MAANRYTGGISVLAANFNLKFKIIKCYNTPFLKSDSKLLFYNECNKTNNKLLFIAI